MPHPVLTGRVRFSAHEPDDPWDFSRMFSCASCDPVWKMYIVEMLDLLGGFVFLVGTLCFFPEVVVNRRVCVIGCDLFILGSAIYLIQHTLTLYEAVSRRNKAELGQSLLYFVGAIFFLVGTVLYWPEHAETSTIEFVKSVSLGSSFHMDSETEATILFIIGSLLFAVAAFQNAVWQQARIYETDRLGRLAMAATVCYLLGSVLFTIGSVGFFPWLNKETYMVWRLGVWILVIGCILFLGGSIFSLAKTNLLLTAHNQKDSLNVERVPSEVTHLTAG